MSSLLYIQRQWIVDWFCLAYVTFLHRTCFLRAKLCIARYKPSSGVCQSVRLSVTLVCL